MSTVPSAAQSSDGPRRRRATRRVVLAVSALVVALVVGVAIAQAGKGVTQIFGENGSGDGQLSNPRDVAVNQAGGGDSGAHDGYTYVADEDNNRITVFDADENFAFAFGSGVAGGSGFQICTSGCVAGDASDEGKGGLDDPQGVDIDQATGRVFVRDRDNRRVQVFSESGGFLFMFGGDVNATEAATGPEVCTQASGDTCKVGENGTDPGFFGTSSTASTGIAVNQANGHVIVADPGGTANRRIQEFDVDNIAFDGTPADTFGGNGTGNGQFGSNQPIHVAVDSAGIVYASDTNTQLECYDTTGDAFCAGGPITDFPGSSSTTAVEVDPANDNLLIATGGQIEELDTSALPAGAAVNTGDPHGISSGLTPAGLGVNTADDTFLFSTISQDQIFILDDTVAPVAAIDAVTTFDAHSATFTGDVDPNNSPVDYRFEYVDDAEFQANGFTNAAKVPVPDEQLGNGDSAVSVEQDVIHLDASTTYHVQLVAEQTYGPSDATDVGTFTTDSAAPKVLGTVATVTGPDEATLRGKIHPENEPTDFFFEWGTDDSYGNTTPVGNLPAGSDPVAVSADLTGLTAGQTYHFRLVAENNTGETLGPDRTFTPQVPQPPATGRAYEVVSPLPTGGVPVLPSQAEVAAGEDGDSIFFKAPQPFPGVDPPFAPDLAVRPGTYAFVYVSRRGPAGWEADDTGLNNGAPGDVAFGPGASYDGSRFLGGVVGPLDPDDQDDNGLDLYQYQPDGSLVWVSRDPRIPQGTPQTDVFEVSTAESDLPAATMSVDGRTVVFYSWGQLADDDTTPGTSRHRLYKWTDGGPVDFIGKRPDGSVPANGSGIGSDTEVTGIARRGAVSRDGSRVVFNAQRTDGQFTGVGLYVHTDGEGTVEATKETGVPPLPANQPFRPWQNESLGALAFHGASADVARVFYTSASRLTPDSGAQATGISGDADLYFYDIAADKVRDITPRLDGIDDPSVDPAAADRAAVQGVAANSEDGRRIYFVAKAAYPQSDPSPTGELPVAGGRNLYLAELDGIDDPIRLRFIANLATGDSAVWTKRWPGKTSYASPDGSVLGFGSSQPLTGTPLGGTEQLFVYDADAHTLACASCPGDGSPPVGDVNPPLADTAFSGDYWQPPPADKRWVSTAGSVFFYTAHPLVAEDVNGTDDAYEYRDGQLRLISTGRDTNPSRFENASRDGSTVFFNTSEALDPRDDEPGTPKLYAARVGGGFAAPPADPAPCEGAECRGDQASALDADEPATSRLRDRTAAVPRRCRALARRAARVNRRSRQLARSVRQLRRRAVRSDDRERSVRMRRAARKRVRRARTLKRRSVVLRRRATSCRRGSR